MRGYGPVGRVTVFSCFFVLLLILYTLSGSSRHEISASVRLRKFKYTYAVLRALQRIPSLFDAPRMRVCSDYLGNITGALHLRIVETGNSGDARLIGSGQVVMK